MNAQDYLAYARQHQEKLRDLIRNWHPASRPAKGRPILPITAPGAEVARQSLAQESAKEAALLLTPVERFNRALEKGDTAEIYSLLTSTWLGVPESTSCWQLTGFAEAVHLLDDPVDLDAEEVPE